MAVKLSQAGRMGRLTTALGADVLVLLSFDGEEAVNDLFTFEVRALSADPDIDFDALIGTHACVEIDSHDHGTRIFDGIVTAARCAGVGENGYLFALTLRPWLWLAGRRRNQRIFHDMSVVDILRRLLEPYGGHGSPALQTKLSGSYPALEYTVQYRESDCDFALRLMERFGISYHFVHEKGRHRCVLTDSVFEHEKVQGEKRPFKANTGHGNAAEEHFWEWHPERRLTVGAVRLTDYNFKRPTAMMEVDQTGDAKYAEGQIESYDYPGDYLSQPEGKGVVKTRLEQERGQDQRHRALGDCVSLGAGMFVSLGGDPVPGLRGTDFLCLVASHHYATNAYGSGQVEGDPDSYQGRFVLMPADAPLAPERKTEMPQIYGPQTAMVVGEGEIDCDEYGRILVHFHWDLAKAFSMRCRVSQNWAGKGWGDMVIPRIGMEVVVEFLEGDPDKPLVTGCVYNGKNDVPYPLPANKTRSTFRSDTHQGQGFNELRFEDEKGREEILLHAQKDETVKVNNNRTVRVNRNEVTSIGRNRFSEVAGLHDHKVGGNMSISVTGSKSETYATGDIGSHWEGIRGLSYALDQETGVAGNFSLTAARNSQTTIGNNEATTIGKDSSLTIAEDRSVSVGNDSTTTVGQNGRMMFGKNFFLDAGDSITLRTGAASITMKKDGTIEIKGKDITINGSGKINVKASSAIVMKGSKIDMN